MNRRLIAVSAALLLGSSGHGAARQIGDFGPLPTVKLVTAQLRGDSFVCSVVNIGSAPLTVNVKIFNENGADITTFIDVNDYISCGKGPIASNHSCEEQAQVDFALAHCRVTFFGAPGGVRAALQSFITVGDRFTSDTVEAR